MVEAFLREENRAEDIILGSLGFGEEAKVISIIRTPGGFRGVGCFPDGEQFEFENEDDITELQQWALDILLKRLSATDS